MYTQDRDFSPREELYHPSCDPTIDIHKPNALIRTKSISQERVLLSESIKYS
ncbi:hypothetical protein SHM7688_03292 [Shimia marina]|uniref:Uncharacterized protein n=1 Tax=Shimia marina TaxID=321267 RepID=A0A0P1ETY0_9RHOB|nr:hypothetical protein SHM7688_03292 [Shimia marina]